MSDKNKSLGCLFGTVTGLIIFIVAIPFALLSCIAGSFSGMVETAQCDNRYITDAYNYTVKLRANEGFQNYDWNNLLTYYIINQEDPEKYQENLVKTAFDMVLAKKDLELDKEVFDITKASIGTMVGSYQHPHYHLETFYIKVISIDPETGEQVETIKKSTRKKVKYDPKWGIKDAFPIANTFKCSYSDSYGAQRAYKEHTHEGTDIMCDKGTPILSVQEGTIVDQEWNELGGWAIGIRSEDKKRYYYYAHMSKYSSNAWVGKHVLAGDVIGYVGDSGYGPEGTTGKFEPHLHFGIKATYDKETDSVWLNPFSLLKFLELNKIDVEKRNNEYVRLLEIEDLTDPD